MIGAAAAPHRASLGFESAGGKGVNVARALRRLGVPVVATGFAGGRAGHQIADGLTSEGILNDFVRIAEPSRTSTAVIDPVSGAHTEINEYGPRVQDHEIDLLLQHGLDELNEREREVVRGRYGLHDREPETLEMLASRLGLTRERIRQIQQEALAKLKRRMLRQGINRESLF